MLQNKECNSRYTKWVVIILIMIAEVSLIIEKNFSLWRLKNTVASCLTIKKDTQLVKLRYNDVIIM